MHARPHLLCNRRGANPAGTIPLCDGLHECDDDDLVSSTGQAACRVLVLPPHRTTWRCKAPPHGLRNCAPRKRDCTLMSWPWPAWAVGKVVSKVVTPLSQVPTLA